MKPFVLMGLLLASPGFGLAVPRLIDLSTTANLTDDLDDSEAFRNAVVTAGEGGGVLIPFGRCMLEQPIMVTNATFTVIGQEEGLSQIVLKNNGVLEMVASTNASYSVRKLGFVRSSGNASSLSLKVPADKRGVVTLREITFSGAGSPSAIVKIEGADVLTMSDITIDGAGRVASPLGMEISGEHESASFRRVIIHRVGTAMNLLNSYQFAQFSGLRIGDIDQGIMMTSPTLPTKMIMNDSMFENGVEYVSIRSPVTLSIADTIFGKHSDTTTTQADISLEHDGIHGTISSCDFARGIRATRVGRLGIAGNVFREGFRNQTSDAPTHIVNGFRARIQTVGNLFMTRYATNVTILNPSGNWGAEVPLVLAGPSLPRQRSDVGDSSAGSSGATGDAVATTNRHHKN